MDNLKNNIITLNRGKYFVLDEVTLDYDIYDLILNVNNENDIKIVMQDIKEGKTILIEITDKDKLSIVSAKLKTSLNI